MFEAGDKIEAQDGAVGELLERCVTVPVGEADPAWYWLEWRRTVQLAAWHAPVVSWWSGTVLEVELETNVAAGVWVRGGA